MDIIMVVIFVLLGAFVTGLSMYFILKEDEKVEKSKSILDYFKVKCEDEDNLDDLIEFSKLHKFKYKI